MDYEAIDKEMSMWLVTCVNGKTRFFLTPERTATDLLSRAERFSDRDKALQVAVEERQEAAWHGGFAWEPVTRPAASVSIT